MEIEVTTPTNDLPGVKPRSIIRAIWNALKSGRALTSLATLQDFGTLCLAQRVSDLRNDYHKPISDRWVELSNGKRVKEYYVTAADRARLNS